MFYNYICGFILLCLGAPVKGLVCEMSLFQNCRYHELVTTSPYQGFISEKNLKDQCSKIDMALKCGQTQKYLRGCDEEELLEYNMVTSLYKSICVDFITEYRNSTRCFQLPNFKEAFEVCSFKFEHPRSDPDYCSYFEEGIICLNGLHDMFPDPSCEMSHFRLQNRIFRLYVEPLRKVAKCPEPEGLLEPSTLPTTTKKAKNTAPNQPSATTTVAAPTFGEGVAPGEASTGSPISRRSQGENGASSATRDLSFIYTVISLICLCQLSIKVAVFSH